jgi:hypothetical protein
MVLGGLMQATKFAGIYASWKKSATLFLIGQALSLFGTMVVQYAITWHITLRACSKSFQQQGYKRQNRHL